MFSASSLAQTPDSARLIAVFLIGVLLAALANYCVDRLGWIVRYRSPWRRFPKELSDKGATPRRTWQDYIPIWGWLAVSRFAFANNDVGARKKSVKRADSDPDKGAPWIFAHIPGWESRFFWVRPFFVEILFAILIAWRYAFWSSVGSGDAFGLTSFSLACWAVETVLFWLALCASLVDLDDYVIPDLLMIPGVLLGLCSAVLFPVLTAPIAWPLDWTGENSTFSVCEFASYLLTSNVLGVCVVGSTILFTSWSSARVRNFLASNTSFVADSDRRRHVDFGSCGDLAGRWQIRVGGRS